MTPDEIQALRENHRKGTYGQCEACDGNGWAPVGEYPCDVIKVLDAWEAERKAIVTALSRGHREMYEIVNEIAKVLYGQQ